MFGRSHGLSTRRLSDKAGSVTRYVDPLIHDDKLRKRIGEAITASLAAGKRAQKQTGLRGAVSRLATDEVLRAQIADAAANIRAAAQRAEKTRKHRLRNTVLFVAGLGLVGVAVKSKLGSNGDDHWAPAQPDIPSTPAD